MKIVMIAGREVKLWRDRARMRCPRCGKNIFFSEKFIKEAYAQLGIKHYKRDKAFYIELGLRGMAKRWNKPVERLRKRYIKRLARQGKSEGQE